jgi:hypothetical protein
MECRFRVPVVVCKIAEGAIFGAAEEEAILWISIELENLLCCHMLGKIFWCNHLGDINTEMAAILHIV